MSITQRKIDEIFKNFIDFSYFCSIFDVSSQHSTYINKKVGKRYLGQLGGQLKAIILQLSLLLLSFNYRGELYICIFYYPKDISNQLAGDFMLAIFVFGQSNHILYLFSSMPLSKTEAYMNPASALYCHDCKTLDNKRSH